MSSKLLSPGAFTLATPKFKEVENIILKKQVYPLIQAQVKDKQGKLKIHETIRFLVSLELIRKSNGDYVLSKKINHQDREIIDFFKDKYDKIGVVDYKLLFLYRLKNVFPFIYEVLRIYFRKIWINKDPQKTFNMLKSELKDYIEENKHLYRSGDINFKLRHVNSVINPILEYLGILYEIPEQDYYIIKIDQALFESLFFKNKKKGVFSIVGLIDFMEKFIPVIMREISINEFKIFPLILLKFKNLSDFKINNSKFKYQADSSYINLVEKENSRFISHIEHDKVE